MIDEKKIIKNIENRIDHILQIEAKEQEKRKE